MTQARPHAGLHADAVTAALLSTWAMLCSTLDQAWVRMTDGVTAAVSGIPAAALNGVWVTGGRDVHAHEIEAALDTVAATGLPHRLQARPANRELAAEVVARRGMVAEPSTPLMCAASVPAPQRPDGLALRALAPEETMIHSKLAGEGFGIPPEIFAPLISSSALRVPGFAVYVGEVSGRPVVTAASLKREQWVGVFNVATPAEHRGRGYGAAITAHAARDAAWAWLQSTPQGYGIYRRLGFETLEHWSCWISPPPA